ncbi:16587_t:CDS:1, partial [Dentiscutata heterogama]
EKDPCDPRTRDTHIAKYGVWEELSFYEPHADISSPTDPHIGPSSIDETVFTEGQVYVAISRATFVKAFTY